MPEMNDQANPTSSSAGTDLPGEASPSPALAPRQDTPLTLLLGLAMVLFFTTMLAFVPRMTGDTFMALAGAEDVLHGHMGQPDDWSFITTDDQVWVNQNWGANMILYGFYQAFGGNGDVEAGSRPGDAGIVAMKMTLVFILSLSVLMGSRWRGASWTMSMLAAGMTCLAVRHYVDMRANLFTLTFVPLFLWSLYWSGKSVHRIWVPVVLLVLWSHIHAAWVFGFGMLGLWGLCQLGARAAAREFTEGWLKRLWPYLAAPLVVLILSSLTSPHGFRNVTYTFESMFGGTNEVWHQVDEWRPIFAERAHFGSPAEFGVQAALLFAIALTYILYRTYRLDEKPGSPPLIRQPRSGTENAAIVFEILLWLIAAFMALSARRFIALPLLTGAPLLARGMTWMLRGRMAAWVAAAVIVLGLIWGMTSGVSGNAATFRTQLNALQPVAIIALGLVVIAPLLAGLLNRLVPRKAHWPVFALAIALIGAGGVEYTRLNAFYRDDSPFMAKHTLYQRMITWDNFPGPMSKFINDNDIAGNVYNDWRWESFFHWYCGDLIKVYLGGRAQTVYTAEQYLTWRQLATPVTPPGGGDPKPMAATHLPRIGANLMAHPIRYQDMVLKLCFEPGGQWVPIFFDGNDWLCAYAGSPQTRQYIEDVIKGRMTYRDPALAAMSKAVCLGATMTRASPNQVLRAIEQAVELQPEPPLYALALSVYRDNDLPQQRLFDFLQSEAIRLSHLDWRRSNGVGILNSQLYVCERLAQAYSQVKPARDYWNQRLDLLQEAKLKAFHGLPVELPEPIPAGGPPGSVWSN